MARILLFGGTVEGRILAEYLNEHQIETYVCVATDYGEQLLPKGKYMKSSAKRLNKEEIERLIHENSFEILIDATHPYAVMVSENIQSACEKTRLPYIRILREEEQGKSKGIYVESIREAVKYLNSTSGNILITTGSKELKEYTKLAQYKERCYARVLATTFVVEECSNLGFVGKHLICMQGPFDKDMNIAMLKHINAAYLVTKESGSTGGFEDKIEAAIETDVVPIVIGRPEQTKGYFLQEAKHYLQKRYNIKQDKKHITILGIGMGDKKLLTLEAEAALRQCQVVVGAKRVLASVGDYGKPAYPMIKNEDIVSFIQEQREYQNIAVVFSGDIGFYSGAKRLMPYLSEYHVQMVCGISSPVYFLSKIGMPWEDIKFISLHGRESNIIHHVRENEKVFALLGGEETVSSICEKLIQNHLDRVRLTVGENLSYEKERIVTGTPDELLSQKFSKMAVILIENTNIKNIEDEILTYGIADELFIRDKVPMTKSEVRSISISKLKLHKASTMVDIGAGTGSVSVEVAQIAKDGDVYAIEKKREGIKLIEANKERFQIWNLHIMEGEATECIEHLPVVTHAFIGGTSGNMKEILKQLLNNNSKIRIVLNIIALETLAEAMTLLKELPVAEIEIVQVGIAKGKGIGDYHLMIGQNPVYIISFTGTGIGDGD